jgi:hypothetical protein
MEDLETCSAWLSRLPSDAPSGVVARPNACLRHFLCLCSRLWSSSSLLLLLLLCGVMHGGA